MHWSLIPKLPELALVVALGALGATAACTSDSGGGILVRQNLASTGETCTFTASADNLFLSRGTIALSSPAPYVLTPLLESRITALMGEESQRTVAMRGARVELHVAGATVNDTAMELDTSSFPAGSLKFTSLFSAPLAPNGGFAAADFDIVPTTLLAALRERLTTGTVHVQLIAEITVYGTLGGDEIESEPFYYPVVVCNDCVVNNVGTCPVAEAGSLGNPCNPYQDGRIDCCSMGDQLVCPAPVSTPGGP